MRDDLNEETHAALLVLDKTVHDYFRAYDKQFNKDTLDMVTNWLIITTQVTEAGKSASQVEVSDPAPSNMIQLGMVETTSTILRKWIIESEES